eukprot:scaffold6296_cov124-Isochrysis_galbana.AAC.6
MRNTGLRREEAGVVCLVVRGDVGRNGSGGGAEAVVAGGGGRFDAGHACFYAKSDPGNTITASIWVHILRVRHAWTVLLSVMALLYLILAPPLTAARGRAMRLRIILRRRQCCDRTRGVLGGGDSGRPRRLTLHCSRNFRGLSTLKANLVDVLCNEAPFSRSLVSVYFSLFRAGLQFEWPLLLRRLFLSIANGHPIRVRAGKEAQCLRAAVPGSADTEVAAAAAAAIAIDTMTIAIDVTPALADIDTAATATLKAAFTVTAAAVYAVLAHIDIATEAATSAINAAVFVINVIAGATAVAAAVIATAVAAVIVAASHATIVTVDGIAAIVPAGAAVATTGIDAGMVDVNAMVLDAIAIATTIAAAIATAIVTVVVETHDVSLNIAAVAMNAMSAAAATVDAPALRAPAAALATTTTALIARAAAAAAIAAAAAAIAAAIEEIAARAMGLGAVAYCSNKARLVDKCDMGIVEQKPLAAALGVAHVVPRVRSICRFVDNDAD